MSVDLPVANPIPESCFRIRLIDAQPSRDSDHLPIWSAPCPAPHPDCSAIRPLPAKSGERLKKLSHQSLHPLHRCAVGEYGLRQHGFGDAEMIVQYALDDRAQVGGRREVAGFIEIGGCLSLALPNPPPPLPPPPLSPTAQPPAR